jgi:hypothetical protein
MPYTLKIDYPASGNGQEMAIPGLGTFKNGSTYRVSDEDAQSFRDYQVSNNMPDQTLYQAFQKSEYVTVEVDKPKDEKKEGDK